VLVREADPAKADLHDLGANKGRAVRHKLLLDEAEALLPARFAAFLLELEGRDSDEQDVATGMGMLAAARSATGTGKAAVEKLLAQAAAAADWYMVSHLLRQAGQAELERAASQLDFLVAFQRGHRIAAGLSSTWLDNGAYTNARQPVDLALAQEQKLDGFEGQQGLQVIECAYGKGQTVRRGDLCSGA
jgi:DNA helicase-2/ATP-dependent DNA helicase PcrA